MLYKPPFNPINFFHADRQHFNKLSSGFLFVFLKFPLIAS